MIASNPLFAGEDDAWSVADFEEALLNKPAGERWELVNGTIVKSMTVGTAAHNLIVGNAYSRVRAALQKTHPNCRALIDFGLATGDSLFYPDLMVTCEALAPTSLKAEAPLVLVEVLSRATRALDLGEKQFAYLGLPSLAHYLVLDQQRTRGKLFERGDGRSWTYRDLEPGSAVFLPAIGLECVLSDFYEGLG